MSFDSDTLAEHSEINNNGQVTTNANFTQFSTRYDSETQSIWCWMHPAPRPCLNPTLLNELEQLQCRLKNIYASRRNKNNWAFKHLILASRSPDIYNLGGDLGLFRELIKNRDKTRLQHYAHQCIQLLHQNLNNLELPITVIALVQGSALGGGFECALSCDVIIAERSAQMGFPEILFNLFPGMGAYNLLAKRIGPRLAERMILSGRTYGAEELYDMGVVDMLADDGDGVGAAERYLKQHNRSQNAIEAIKKAGKIVSPITEQDLMDVVDIWVEAAMNLSEKDLNKMERLIYAQNTLDTKTINENKKNRHIPRHGDWRKIENVEFPLMTHLGENILHNRRQSDRCRRENS
ncbi:MAG TPA: enoyl-CoA hydratase [Thiotrichales bacterium]|nr:enoyl-CoA hydratase [Thiotrichales bacterium]